MTIKDLIFQLQRLDSQDRIVCMSQDAQTCDEVLVVAEPQETPGMIILFGRKAHSRIASDVAANKAKHAETVQ